MKNRRLWIEDGRHPVVEKAGQSTYVPEQHSSTVTSSSITGPNMSGKSTYMTISALVKVDFGANRMLCTAKKVQRFPFASNLFHVLGQPDDLISWAKYVHGRDDGDKSRAETPMKQACHCS